MNMSIADKSLGENNDVREIAIRDRRIFGQ